MNFPIVGALLCVVLVARTLAAEPSGPAAFDMATPARVRVTVVDENNRPVAGAVVTLNLSGPGNGIDTTDRTPARKLSATSDRKGLAEISVDHPLAQVDAFAYAWTRARIEVAGKEYETFFSPDADRLELSPGIELSRRAVLDRTRTTRIHFEKPDGTRFPFVNFAPPFDRAIISHYPLNGYFADARGEYEFVHGRLDPGSPLVVGAARYDLADSGTTVIRLSAAAMKQAVAARQVEGRVLLADGSPAAGWRIAWNIFQGAGWDWGSGATHRRTESLSATQEAILPANGRFRLLTVGRWLVAISPEGIPFRFPIDAQVWPEGQARRLTLRIPPLQRIQRGQLNYSNQQLFQNVSGPASGLVLSLEGMISEAGDLQWTFGMAGPGRPNPKLTRTDSDGRYEIPIYYGDEPYYRTTTAFPEVPGIIARDPVVTVTPYGMGPRTIPAPPPVKRLRLSIEDETGKSVFERLGAQFRLKFEVPGQPFQTWVGGDAGSRHVFVPVAATALTITSEDNRLLRFSTTVALENQDDQLLRIRVPEAVMPHLLSGVVLGPDGRPVPGLQVNAYVLQVSAFSNGLPAPSWIDLPAYTDAQGRFTLTAAPPAGGLSLRRVDYGPLPGWSPAQEFSAGERDLSIRLSAGGTVRILPQDMADGSPFGFVLRPPAQPWLIGNLELAPDPATGASIARNVPPGRYTLVRFDRENNQQDQQVLAEVEVQPGQEVVIDPAKLAPVAARIVNEVSVTLDGRPFAGAVVSVLPPPAGPTLPRGDVSDDAGHARIAGPEGETLTLQARVPGQWIGSTTLEFQPGRTAVIPLRPEPK